jgi:hypothetical protein
MKAGTILLVSNHAVKGVVEDSFIHFIFLLVNKSRALLNRASHFYAGVVLFFP